MNSDISSDMTKYSYINTKKSAPMAQPAKMQKDSSEILADGMHDSSMDYLNAMGRTKVNMDNPDIAKNVRASFESFKRNPDMVQAHVEFCDSLLERGYCMEDAVRVTDKVFTILAEGDTYKGK